MTTPLGSAVAPDVKMISAVSSRVMAVAGGSDVVVPVDVFEAPDLSGPRGQRAGIDVLADERHPGLDDAGDARRKSADAR